jgi:hypothetical protein
MEEDIVNKIAIAARESELEDRVIIWEKKLIHTRRQTNIAVLTDEDIVRLLEEEETSEHLNHSLSNYPLCHKCGFVSALEEKQFNIHDAAISDVAYMGLIPKKVMNRLKKTKEKNQLICLIIWRAILVQKTISFIIKKLKRAIMDTENVRKTEVGKVEKEDEPTNEITDLEASKEQPGTRKPLTDKTNIVEIEREMYDKARKRNAEEKKKKGHRSRNQQKKQKK